jgi:hypothetical protein
MTYEMLMETRMTKLSRKTLNLAGVVVFVGLFAPVATFAQGAPATASGAQEAKADTSCFLAPAKLSASEVDAFLANPSKLLTDEPSGGLPLSNKARALGGSSMVAAEKLVELSNSATDIQKAAIGAGLSRVVQACASFPDFASNIQNLVAGLGDPTVIAAFMAASSDVQTAAVGGAGVGAAGGGVGGGATSDTSGQSNADNSTTFGGNATAAQSSGSGFDVGSASASPFDIADAGGSTTVIVSPTN